MTEVGRLNVRLNLDSTAFNTGISNVQRRLQGLQRGFSNFGRMATRYVTAPMVGGAVALGALAVKTGEMADELIDMSATVGVSTDRLQQWRGMAARAGIDADTFSSAMETLNRRMARGSATVVEGIESMGYSFEEFRQLDPSDQMDAILQAMAELEQKDAIDLANKLGIPDLLPARDIIKDLMEDVENFSDIWEEFDFIDQEMLERAAEFYSWWNEIKNALSIIVGEVGVQIIDMFQELTGIDLSDPKEAIVAIEEALSNAVEWVKNLIESFMELNEKTDGLAGKFLLLLPVLGPVSAAFSILMGIATLLVGALGGIKKAVVWLAGSKGFKALGIAAGSSATLAGLALLLGKLALIAAALWGIVEAAKRAYEWIQRVREEGYETVAKEESDRHLRDSRAGMGRGGGGFDMGGVIPGPRGLPQLALVHGGETVVPTHKTGMGPSIVMNVTQNIADKATAEYANTDLVRRLQDKGLVGAMR